SFPGRFLAARATNIPILGRLADRMLFDGDDLVFLPQDRILQSIAVDEGIERPGEIVLPSQVVEHFVNRANVHWIMDFCICRAAEGCRDYPMELGCLFLGEAALGINPELGCLVTREEALEHVARCREAGLIHLVGRNKLDTVWLGVGPGRKLLTICNCCPCCCLWRILPYLTPRIADKVARLPGVTVTVNDRCVGCGTCTEGVCFADAISLKHGQAVIDAACRGCGRCVDVCPQRAIELSIDDGLHLRRTISRIAGLVDVE
ncbi:MAG: 4Fe-4S binding protein, partial [Anaerolineae bacterium]